MIRKSGSVINPGCFLLCQVVKKKDAYYYFHSNLSLYLCHCLFKKNAYSKVSTRHVEGTHRRGEYQCN